MGIQIEIRYPIEGHNMNIALADWDGNASQHQLLVWWTRLDGRWQIEVHRVDAYTGMLCIFDHLDKNILRHSEPVGLAYGAILGPDFDDVSAWQNKAIEFVDSHEQSAMSHDDIGRDNPESPLD